MKTIYTFTLEGERCYTDKFGNDLRLLAHMLYHSIYNYDVNGSIPLDINNNIVYNEIHDSPFDCGYYLDSDIYVDSNVNYEPFLIGCHSFGITVVDDSVNEQILNRIINQLLYMLKLDYKIKISSVSYTSKKMNDESNRRKAMRLVFDNLGCVMPPRKITFSRKKIFARPQVVIRVCDR